MKLGINTKKVRLILWFLVAIALDLTVMQKISIFNAKPMLTYSMIVSAMLSEDDFSAAMITAFAAMLVCASLFMQSFAFEAIFIMIASVAIYSLGRKIRYIPMFVISGIASAVFVVIHILLAAVISSGAGALYAIGNILVANAIYTFIAAMGVHLLLNRSVYSLTDNKFKF